MSINLDMECAKLGSELAKKTDEKTLTDALSVLEEQGLYALFLYLKQKHDRNGVLEACRGFLAERFRSDFQGKDAFEAARKLSENLDALLFARDLLRQALVYGRYHAKAGAAPGGDR